MIIIGYQGIGKSTLASKDNNFIDLESSSFFHNGKRPNNWYVYYCNIAANLSRQGYNVFVSSHEVVRNRLKKYFSDEKVICIYPSIDLKDEWIKKLKDRFDKDISDKNYKAWMNAVDRYIDNIIEIKNCGIPGIEITSMDYDLHGEIVKGVLGLKMDINNVISENDNGSQVSE